jgi:excisionase family DNA binding protein
MNEDVFTVKELKKYLKIGENTALKLLKSGKVKANKVGRNWRILKSEVDNYLRGNSK